MALAARAKYSMFAWNGNETINFRVLLRNISHGKVLFSAIVFQVNNDARHVSYQKLYFIFSYVTQVYLLVIDLAVILYS